MRIHALIYTGSIITAEVAFHIAGDIVSVKIFCDLDVQARKLRRGSEFGHTPLSGVVVGYTAEVCCNIALRVCRAKNVLEVDKPTEGQYRVTQFDGPERHLRFCLFLTLLSRLLPDIGGCKYRRRLK